MQPDQGFIMDSDIFFKIAKDGYQKASKGYEIHRQNDALVAIVFSALALEAFINELLVIAKMEKQSGSSEDWLDKLIEAIEEPSTDDIPAKKPNGWIKCSNKFLNTFKLELRFIPVVKRKSTREKFMSVSEALGSPFDKGSSPYQDFADLSKLRDCLVHLKPEDLIEPDEDKIYNYLGRKLIEKLRSKVKVNSQPDIGRKPIEKLQSEENYQSDTSVKQMILKLSNGKMEKLPSKGILQNYTSVKSITLLVSTAEASKWACNTTSKMVNAILDKLNEIDTSSFTKDNELLALYRESFKFLKSSSPETPTAVEHNPPNS